MTAMDKSVGIKLVVILIGWVVIAVFMFGVVPAQVGDTQYDGTFEGGSLEGNGGGGNGGGGNGGGDNGGGGGNGSPIDAYVTVEVTHISFTDEVDVTWLGSPTTEGEPVVKITIDGDVLESPKLWTDDNEGEVYFSHEVFVSGKTSVSITIELWEEDASGYDHCDISSGYGRDCELTYYFSTSSWSGDTSESWTSGSSDGTESTDDDDAYVEFNISHR